MSIDDLKTSSFIVSYIRHELGRDIKTEASKIFKVTQKTDYITLKDFAAKNALVFQTEEITGVNIAHRIHILDLHKQTHLLATEIE